jgi:hypothetical protein
LPSDIFFKDKFNLKNGLSFEISFSKNIQLVATGLPFSIRDLTWFLKISHSIVLKSIRGFGNLRKLVFGNSKAGFEVIYLQKSLLVFHFKGWEEDGFKCKIKLLRQILRFNPYDFSISRNHQFSIFFLF